MASRWGGRWWIAMAITVALLLTLWVVMSWLIKPFIPECVEFNRIRALPYDEQNMNCSHKAIMYAAYLKDRGWRCWVVAGSVFGHRKEHAWVVVEDKKKMRRLCDPTGPIGGASGYQEDSYKTYRPRHYFDQGVIVR